MASIVLGVAGSYFGGPIGGMAGAFIGGLIDNALMPKQKGPQLTDLQVTGASYGQPIPLVYGATRVAGTVIQSSDLVKHTSGGKGGGGGGQQTTYTATFAVSIAAGPITSVWRIWADGHVIYDARPAAIVGATGIKVYNTGGYSQYMTFYLGNETQTPDTNLEALVGAGNQPAYRGTAYMVCHNFPVSDFGNRVPNFQFEVLGLSDSPSSLAFQTNFQGKNNAWSSTTSLNRSAASQTDMYGNMILCDTQASGWATAQAVAPDGHQVWQMTIAQFVTQLQNIVGGAYVAGSYNTFTVAPIIGSGQWLYFTMRKSGTSIPGYSFETWVAIAAPTTSGTPTLIGAARIGCPLTGPPYTVGLAPLMVAGNQTSGDPVVGMSTYNIGALDWGLYWMPPVNWLLSGQFNAGNGFVAPAVITTPIVSTNLSQNLASQQTARGHAYAPIGWMLPTVQTGALPPYTLFATNLYFYFNHGIMDYQATAISPAICPEIQSVLQPVYPGGCMIEIGFGLVDYGFLYAQGLASGTVPYNFQPASASSYTVANNSFVDSTGAQAVPFTDEHTFLSSGAAGGLDTYSPQPAYIMPQGNGSYVVGFVMKGVDDAYTNLNGSEMFVSARLFVYNPVTNVFTQANRVQGLLYTNLNVGGTGTTASVLDDYVSVLYQPTTGTFMLGGYLSNVPVTGTAYWAELATVVGHGNVSLADIVEDVCLRCGLASALFDVTALESTILDGYTITSDMSGRSALQPLQQIFIFDGIESDWVVKWRLRAAAPVGSISENDLGARANGVTQDLPKIQEMRGNDVELPRGIQIKFFYPGIDYQIATQHVKRPTVATNARNITTISAAITMEPAAARNACETALYLAWLRREQYTISVPLTALAYDPGDVVTLNYTDQEGLANAVPAYITKANLGADNVIQIEAQQTDSISYSPVLAGQAPIYNGSSFSVFQAVTFDLIDGPLLRDADDSAGFYAAAYGTSSNWTGGPLMKSVDGGSTFAQIGTFTAPDTIGTAVNALPAVTNYSVWDITSTLTVSLNSGSLSSVAPNQVTAGTNNALVGTPSTGYELIGFMNATLLGPNIYRLSGLLRGQQGTDWFMGSHAMNEQFILVAQNGGVLAEGLQLSEIGLPRKYEAYSAGVDLSTVTPVSFTCLGVRIKPLSPILAKYSRDGSNNLTLSWTPRRRLSDDIQDNIDPYVDEAVESYSTDIIVSGSVVRTIASTSPTLAYSAANQTTDGITPGNPVTVKIYQVSSRIGRGYPGAFTG